MAGSPNEIVLLAPTAGVRRVEFVAIDHCGKELKGGEDFCGTVREVWQGIPKTKRRVLDLEIGE